MPYVMRKRRQSTATNHEALVSAVAKELTEPKTLTEAVIRDLESDRPTVIEEGIRGTDRVQLFVVWDEWSGVREEHRSTAILDAYEQVFGHDAVMRVIVALGVTRNEAKELGVIEG